MTTPRDTGKRSIDACSLYHLRRCRRRASRMHLDLLYRAYLEWNFPAADAEPYDAAQLDIPPGFPVAHYGPRGEVWLIQLRPVSPERASVLVVGNGNRRYSRDLSRRTEIVTIDVYLASNPTFIGDVTHLADIYPTLVPGGGFANIVADHGSDLDRLVADPLVADALRRLLQMGRAAWRREWRTRVRVGEESDVWYRETVRSLITRSKARDCCDGTGHCVLCHIGAS